MYIDILELGVVTRTVQVLRTTSGTSTSTGIYSYCTQYIQIYCNLIVIVQYFTCMVRVTSTTQYGRVPVLSTAYE